MEKLKVFKNEFEVNLEKKFHLSSLHYIATFLHSQLKHLPFLSPTDRNGTVEDVKKILVTLGITDTITATEELPAKVSKSVVDEFVASGTNRDEMMKIVYKDRRVLIFDDVVKWWSKQEDLPKLAELSRFIFSIPASEATSERLFSTSGRIVEERRQRLDPENVDSILFIKDVKKLNTCSEFKLTHCFDFLIMSCGAVRLRI